VSAANVVIATSLAVFCVVFFIYHI